MGGGGGYAARLFILFSFPCSADHERDWPKQFFRVGNQYAECEKHSDFSLNNNNNNWPMDDVDQLVLSLMDPTQSYNHDMNPDPFNNQTHEIPAGGFIEVQMPSKLCERSDYYTWGSRIMRLLELGKSNH